MRSCCAAALLIVMTAALLSAAPATAPATAPTTQRTIEGVVTDVNGHPRPYVYLGKTLDDYSRDVVTDTDGRFTIKDAPTTQRTWLAFPGPSGKAGLFVVPPQGQPAHVKLQFGVAELDGRVVDPQGRGVKGLRVELAVRYEGEEYLLAKAKTDAGGYFNSYVHAGDTLQLLVRAFDGDRLLATAEPVTLKDGQSFRELPDLIVRDAKPEQLAQKDTRQRVSGRVIDDQGKPIAGAKVELEYSYRQRMGINSDGAQTDADGRWSRRVPADVNTFRLSLEHGQYTSSIFENAFPSPPLEKLADGSAVSVMKRGLLVRGEVRDEHGNPVPDALILTQPLISSSGGYNQPIEDATMTRSGADGAFQIGGIPPGPRDLVVYGRNLAPAVVKVVASAEMQPVRATLGAGRQISGVVTDQDGTPLAGARVNVQQWTPAVAGSGNHRLPREAFTGPDGRFALTHIPVAGSLELSYGGKGFRTLYDDDVPIDDEPITLKLIKPGVVAGRVVDDATGEPVKAFQLTTGSESEKGPVFADYNAWKVTSADGTFKKKVDFGGRTDPLRVIADGYLVLDTTISTSEDAPPVDIRLKKGEPYTGIAVDEGGKPVAGAEVAWVGPGRQAFIRDGKLQGSFVYRADIVVQADARGRFRLPRTTQPGSIVITSAYGYAAQRDFEFKDGEPVKLAKWARVSGFMRDGDAPVAQRYVVLFPPDAEQFQDTPINWMISAATDADGSFLFAHVPPQPLRVVRREVSLISHATLIDPQPGQSVEVVLGGSGGASVSGRLERPATIAAGIFNGTFDVGKYYTSVYARPADGPKPSGMESDVGYVASLQPDGAFAIHGLPPGKYTLHAKVHAPPMAESCGIPIAIASAEAPFEVSAKQALTLPTLAIKPHAIGTAGAAAPALAGNTLDGQPMALEQLKGKVVLIDFWASWCAPCKAETPRLKKLWAKHGGDKFAILGVNLDYTADAGLRYQKEAQLPWPSINIAGWGRDNAVLQSWGISALPSFWLIAPDGRVIARDVKPEELEAVLKGAVARFP